MEPSETITTLGQHASRPGARGWLMPLIGCCGVADGVQAADTLCPVHSVKGHLGSHGLVHQDWKAE